ncbi:hypothetical protein MLD38_034332 [Melastoma candidum]|uniref:Uncharacterized protein n=1 Tax=Melastoma candidum TaxID=119954 RepID=A0ACB9MBY0_9MYRT|nr:hypothetical protein MLD38_034332 [Melastoma candidum]
MNADEKPVPQGLLGEDAANDAGTGKERELTEKEGKDVGLEKGEMGERDKEEVVVEDEFLDGRAGSLNPVSDGSDTLPSDVIMGESGDIPREVNDDVVPRTNANVDSMAGVVHGKPEGLSAEAMDDGVKAEEEVPKQVSTEEITTPKADARNSAYSNKWLIDAQMGAADVSGTAEEQATFMKELERFHKEKALDFKPPKFYGEPLNCLKLWRSVIMLGGYNHVTTNKFWRQIGESFHPPKTCTTISWTFRIFYEKALLEYERHEVQVGLLLPVDATPMQTNAHKETGQAGGSHKGRCDSSSRTVKGLRNAEFGEDLSSTSKREKNLRGIGLVKQKNSANHGHMDKDVHSESDKRMVTTVVDVGPLADWVKVTVRENQDCFEIYALVPGLLREEVRVQSDPAGRLVITGQPEQLENPWGITPFKKVINLPARIDPRQTSAVVSLHGRLYVRVPIEQGLLTDL